MPATNFTLFGIGACNCGSTVASRCNCPSVPTVLNMTSVLYGAFVLTWNPSLLIWSSGGFLFNYAGCVHPFTCPASTNCPGIYELAASGTGPCGLTLAANANTWLGSGCPSSTGSFHAGCGYTLFSTSCSPFQLVYKLSATNICACGPGDTATITP